MSPSKLSVFANLALAASAVLIPSTMSLDDFHSLQALAIDPSKQSVALECPGCAFATAEGEELKWKAGAGNAFLLNFTTGPHEQSLTLDNYQLYPPSFNLSNQPFYVTQSDPTSTGEEASLRLRVTGYNFRFNGATTISDDGTELLPMSLKITSVEGTTVNPPALGINVLKTAEGGLMIASFHAAEIVNKPTTEDKVCNEWPLLCKWKNIMADRVAQMKKKPGCNKRPHHARPGNPMAHEGAQGKPPHRFRPGKPHHPHQHPHHAHQHQRLSTFASRAFFTVFVPVLIGIFVGTLTYLVGMFLGCVIAVGIARVRGQMYQRVALQEEDIQVEAEERGEKETYVEVPAYEAEAEAPPVYEEAVETETK